MDCFMDYDMDYWIQLCLKDRYTWLRDPQCNSMMSHLINNHMITDQGRPQDLGGGGPRNFFFRFGNLHVAKRHAAHGEAMRIARGVRGHAPPRKFFKTVQFGAF